MGDLNETKEEAAAKDALQRFRNDRLLPFIESVKAFTAEMDAACSEQRQTHLGDGWEKAVAFLREKERELGSLALAMHNAVRLPAPSDTGDPAVAFTSGHPYPGV